MGMKWTLSFLMWVILACAPQQAWCQMLDNSTAGTNGEPVNTSEQPSSDITTGIAPGVSTTGADGHTSYTILPGSGISGDTRKWAADKTAGADYYDPTIPGEPTLPYNQELVPKPPEYNLGYSTGHTPGTPVGGSTMNPDGHTTYTVYTDSGISPATRIMIYDKTARGANFSPSPVVTGYVSGQGPDAAQTPDTEIKTAPPLAPEKPKKKGHPFRTLMKGVGVGLVIFSIVSPVIGMPSFGSAPCH